MPVSVVIPCFNAEKYIQKTIDSIANQTQMPVEIICVDDCSSDGTKKNLEDLAKTLPLRVLQTPKNSGPAAARNLGWRNARSEWIAFMDSDDLWSPEKIDICSQRLHEADVISHWEILDDGKSQRVLRHSPRRRDILKSLLLDANFLSPSAVLVRRTWLEKVGGFNESPELITAEDFDLWILLAKSGAKFKFLEEPLGKYILHANNSTGSIARHRNAILKVLENHKSLTATWSLRERLLFRRRFADVHYSAGRAHQRAKELKKALQEFHLALRFFPLHFKTIISIFLGPILRR